MESSQAGRGTTTTLSYLFLGAPNQGELAFGEVGVEA
jgi:hypothetical protein